MIGGSARGSSGGDDAEGVKRDSQEERVEGPSTPGMDRFTALATDRVWAGGARTEPGMTSAWHHHGDHESVIHVLCGALGMEVGPGGRESFDAGPGDFVLVGRGEVRRESNPSAERRTSWSCAPGAGSREPGRSPPG